MRLFIACFYLWVFAKSVDNTEMMPTNDTLVLAPVASHFACNEGYPFLLLLATGRMHAQAQYPPTTCGPWVATPPNIHAAVQFYLCPATTLAYNVARQQPPHY